MKSKYLKTLPQYHFERDKFVEAFKKIFSDEEIEKVLDLCINKTYLDDFLLTHYEDEFYIIHLDSGTIINWYKHLGRTNTCNKEGFAYEDLIKMLKMLKEDVKGNNLW